MNGCFNVEADSLDTRRRRRLEQIARYLSKEDPSLAQSTIRRLYNTAKSLKGFPNRGRIGQLGRVRSIGRCALRAPNTRPRPFYRQVCATRTEEGTRELVLAPLPKYIIIYQVEEHAVHIARIIHTSRDRR